MMSYPLELSVIIQRAANRGIKFALEHDDRFVDLFQHIKDEAERLEQALELGKKKEIFID